MDNTGDPLKAGTPRKRRNSDSDDLDQLVNQIAEKLQHLETSDNYKTQIDVFLEVMCCSEREASFFLESSNWDISTAVALYLEQQPNIMKRPRQPIETHTRYRKRIVNIEGLDKEWRALVSASTGQIYFQHIATGLAQYEVPPGFADNSSCTDPVNDIHPGPSIFATENECSYDGLLRFADQNVESENCSIPEIRDADMMENSEESS